MSGQDRTNAIAALKAIDDRISAMDASADKTALRSSMTDLVESLHRQGWDLRRGPAGAGYPLNDVA